VSVITQAESRWARRDIKSTNLLANVLARQAAREAGAFETWFVGPDGAVSEGASSNAWIVDNDGVLRTPPLSHEILHGVTRAEFLSLAQQLGMRVEQRSFSVAQAQASAEAFVTSAGNPGLSVVAIDGVVIGSGKPGPVAAALRRAYLQENEPRRF
jgi:D-alanine transaminase